MVIPFCRKIYGSSRSHVYLAEDNETKTPTIIKIPSIDLRNDSAYLERFFNGGMGRQAHR
jgi:serine/threonine protein kinase